MEFLMPGTKLDYEINKIDAYPRLSGGMRQVVDYQNANAKDAFVTNCGWDELRQKYVEERRFWNEGGPQPWKVTEETVEGPEGAVPVRIYYPDDKPLRPAVVFIHGGGFTVGSNDTHDRMMRCVMAASGCAVIGVDYRLAPEYKFPVPLYECAAVVRFFQEHGTDYGISPDRMALGGDSGGANLAMAVNLYLRDTPGGNDFIRALLLFYGYFGLTDSQSARLHGSLLDGMRRADFASYLSYYLEPGDLENPYFAVLGNDLTRGIPASYFCCGDMDPLRDDTLVLKEILDNHGVRTRLDMMPGVLHAYMHYGRMMNEAVQCLNHSGDFLKEELAR